MRTHLTTADRPYFKYLAYIKSVDRILDDLSFPSYLKYIQSSEVLILYSKKKKGVATVEYFKTQCFCCQKGRVKW